MSIDYYVNLANTKACPKQVNECGLASGFVDECTVVYVKAEFNRADAEQREKSAVKRSDVEREARNKKNEAEKKKNETRKCYMERVKSLELSIPKDLRFEPTFANLPNSQWFGIEVSFTLQSPWYSKDDRAFHVMDNPVRKDRVFGVPFMSAASWKGLLRWTYGMNNKLIGPCIESDKDKIKKAQKEIVHLFGNEKEEKEEFRSGTLVFYPTWFNKIGFEVINPHDRARRAGIQPIYYEVVPTGTKGTLRLLYAPLPGEIERDKVKPDDFIDNLIDSISALFETYGFSAKRTAGWGLAKIDKWTGFMKDSGQPMTANPQPKKKSVNSLQEIKTLVPEQNPPGSFTSTSVDGFKQELKKRFRQEASNERF